MKRNILLIGILGLVLVISAVLIILRQQKSTETVSGNLPALPLANQNVSKLVLEYDPAPSNSATTKTAYLMLETNTAQIQQVQARLQFNKTYVNSFTVSKPKTTTSILGYSNTQYTVTNTSNISQGTVNYSLVFSGQPTNYEKPLLIVKEPIAKITLTLKNGLIPDNVQLVSFLPGTDVLAYTSALNVAQTNPASVSNSMLVEVKPLSSNEL